MVAEKGSLRTDASGPRIHVMPRLHFGSIVLLGGNNH